jgi:hypothetical protein
MADQNSARNFFARARAKGYKNNRDSINAEEVKKNFRKVRSVITVGIEASGSEGWLTDNENEPLSDNFVLSHHRYQGEHPDTSLERKAASKEFVGCIVFVVEGQYDDPWACMSTVVPTYKDFTGGWHWKGHPKIAEKFTLSTSNVNRPRLP